MESAESKVAGAKNDGYVRLNKDIQSANASDISAMTSVSLSPVRAGT